MGVMFQHRKIAELARLPLGLELDFCSEACRKNPSLPPRTPCLISRCSAVLDQAARGREQRQCVASRKWMKGQEPI